MRDQTKDDTKYDSDNLDANGQKTKDKGDGEESSSEEIKTEDFLPS